MLQFWFWCAVWCVFSVIQLTPWPPGPGVLYNIGDIDQVQVSTYQVILHIFLYNHARRLRLEKYYIELSRSPNEMFEPLLDPGGRFASETETATRWLQN